MRSNAEKAAWSYKKNSITLMNSKIWDRASQICLVPFIIFKLGFFQGALLQIKDWLIVRNITKKKQ